MEETKKIRGRPKGKTSSYTVSEKALAQRVKAPLKHGLMSRTFMALVPKCDVCFVRDSCRYRLKMSPSEQMRGCKDVREFYLAKLKDWGRSPLLKITDEIARLDMLRDMQLIKDGTQGEISEEYFKLVGLMDKLLNTFHKFDVDPDNVRDKRSMTFNQVEDDKLLDVSSIWKDAEVVSSTESEKVEQEPELEPEQKDPVIEVSES